MLLPMLFLSKRFLLYKKNLAKIENYYIYSNCKNGIPYVWGNIVYLLGLWK